MENKNINATGIALAFTLGIISFVCLALFLVAPVFTLNLFGSFMHGVDLTKIAITPTVGARTLLGFVVALVGGYLIGVIFSAIYNKLAGGKK